MYALETKIMGRYPQPARSQEDMTETSRLADQVTVVKGMDGMVVYVPDPEDTDIP